MIEIINEDFNKDVWNARAAHPMQSWEWGAARASMGINVLRIAEYEGKKLLHVFQITFHSVPKTPFKIGYLPRSVFPSKEVIEFLYDYGKRNNVISIKLEPNHVVPAKAGIQNSRDLDSSLRWNDKRLVKSPTPLFPRWTQTIDLTKSEEELLKQMKPKTRYNIRLAQKKGVTVEEMTNDRGFELFIKLYFETTARQHYSGHNADYHRTIFNKLKDKISHILVATYEGEPLAAYELFLFNNVLYYPYGGSSMKHKEVMAPNLIMWEAIRFGKKHGAMSFDLWGSLSPDYDKNDKWSGFTRFKEGYGASFTEMTGSYDIVVRPLLYKAFTAAQRLRERIL